MLCPEGALWVDAEAFEEAAVTAGRERFEPHAQKGDSEGDALTTCGWSETRRRHSGGCAGRREAQPASPRTSFVGRHKEVVEVKRALAMTRLLTLTGAGGSGKTRLALEVAGAARYRLLEPVRQYALEKLEESGEAEAARRAHAAYFLAEEAEPELLEAGQGGWLRRLRTELGNLRGRSRGL